MSAFRCLVILLFAFCYPLSPGSAAEAPGQAIADSKRWAISQPDRLRLNHMAIHEEHQAIVMLLCDPKNVESILTSLKTLGAELEYRHDEVGYLRVRLDTPQLGHLVS